MSIQRTDLQGKHIALVGFGKESAAIARFAARKGVSSISITDTSSAEKLAPMLATISDLTVPITVMTDGNHPEAWEHADIIFVSPGITPGFQIKLPGIAEAVARGAILSNHTQLLFEYAPVPIVGVTGSAGKTTTTTLVGEMLKAQGGRQIFVGGNMGIPLINELDKMQTGDLIVLEISEVQLARLHASPHVGAIINVVPDHFDRYPTFAEYVRAKRQMVRDMESTDFAVLNYDNIPSRESVQETRAAVYYTSRQMQVDRGADVRDDAFWLHMPDIGSVRLTGINERLLPGPHNIDNILIASMVSSLAGASPAAIAQTIRTFRGVSQRIEFVADHAGVKYYSDSIATSPERMMAALRSFDAPILLIAGGKDKNLPWDEGAREIVRRVRVVAVLGYSAQKILDAIAIARAEVPASEQLLERVEQVQSIEAATEVLAHVAHPGEIVLLSPGCTSHDMFSGYQERGDRFIAAVNAFIGVH